MMTTTVIAQLHDSCKNLNRQISKIITTHVLHNPVELISELEITSAKQTIYIDHFKKSTLLLSLRVK